MSGPILSELSRLRKMQEASEKKVATSDANGSCLVKIPLSERPFDPVLGPEQLAHAKQRIRELSQENATLEATVVVLKDAMARRQDILDYVRQIILHDATALSLFPDEAKAAEYQRMYLSVLDGDTLHGMSAELERQVLGEQLAALTERVRVLDARDATKSKTLKEKDQRVQSLSVERDSLSLQLGKSKAHHASLYHALQEAKQDLMGVKESLAASKREAEMLRQSMDSILSDLKAKENQLAYSQQMVRNLEAQLNALASQSEAEKLAAAEMQKQIRSHAAELMRLAEQSSTVVLESPVWHQNVQQTADVAERIRNQLANSAAFGVVGEPLKQAVAAVTAQVSNVKQLILRLEALRRQVEDADGEWAQVSLSVDATLVAAVKETAAIMRGCSDARELAEPVWKPWLRAVSSGGSGNTLRFPCAAFVDVFGKLCGALQSVCDASISNPLLNGSRITTLEEANASLQSKLDAATGPRGIEFDEQKVRALQEQLHAIRALQESKGVKLSFVMPKGKDAVCEYVDALQTEITALRSVDKPAVPPTVVVTFMDLLTADLNILKSARRDAQKSAELMMSLESAMDRLRAEAAEAAGRAPPPPPAAPEPQHVMAPSTLQLLSDVSSLFSEALRVQSASWETARAADYSNREAARQLMLKATAAVDQLTIPRPTSGGHLDVDSTILSCLRDACLCVRQECDESQLWAALVSNIDEPFLLMALRNQAVPTTDQHRKRLSVRMLHAQHMRQQAKPKSASLIDILSPTPPPPEVTVPAPRDGRPMSSQTDALRQKIPETSVEDAIRIVKKAGKWPKMDPKALHADEYVQTLAKRGSYRGTQTALGEEFVEVGTLTDGYLLEGYLGLRKPGDSGAVEPRRRGASIVQIFGDSGVLEQVGAAAAELVHAVVPQRTASSIPSRRHSLSGADGSTFGGQDGVTTGSAMCVVPARSFRAPSKHSIDALLQRRQSQLSASAATTKDSADSDSDGTNSDVQVCQDDAVFTFPERPPATKQPSTLNAAKSVRSGSGVATVVIGADLLNGPTALPSSHEPNDFYELLQKGKPKDATVSSASRRPSSASFVGLRERARQVSVIHEHVRRMSLLEEPPQTEIAARNQKILEVAGGSNLEGIEEKDMHTKGSVKDGTRQTAAAQQSADGEGAVITRRPSSAAAQPQRLRSLVRRASTQSTTATTQKIRSDTTKAAAPKLDDGGAVEGWGD